MTSFIVFFMFLPDCFLEDRRPGQQENPHGLGWSARPLSADPREEETSGRGSNGGTRAQSLAVLSDICRRSGQKLKT